MKLALLGKKKDCRRKGVQVGVVREVIKKELKQTQTVIFIAYIVLVSLCN